ncbi:hypothetical protein HDV06_005293 [Boothiomyces sp. JEL0866]|nr:hypothetical protein HDV06_005293 [Boothiomyces sp. JEL0866]
MSAIQQIIEHVQLNQGIKVYQTANIQLHTGDDVTTVLNSALQSMTGRNKLYKFIKQIKELVVVGHDLNASIYTADQSFIESTCAQGLQDKNLFYTLNSVSF